MAWTKDNILWMLRSTSGRDNKITDIKEFETLVFDYFKKTVEENIVVGQVYSPTGKKEELTRPMPFTKEGLALHCGYCNWNSLKNIVNQGNDFFKVLTRAETLIYKQKFDHATVGVYNHSIIARDLGLIDKQEIEEKVTKIRVGFGK